MSAFVILARHAHHDEIGRVLSGRSAIALSAAGRAQAEQLAERLDGAGITEIHSSPRPRTMETASYVSERLRLPVIPAPELEEIEFGDWTGRSFAYLAGDPLWQRWQTERADVRPPGGETIAEAATRASRYLESHAREGATLLAFSHADTIKSVVARALDFSFSHIVDFDIDPASRTTLDFAQPRPRVIAVNERLA